MSATAQQKKIFNAIMIVAALALVVAGVLAALWLRGNGPFQAQPAHAIAVSEVSGNVNIERAGLSRALEQGEQLREGDVLQTESQTSVTASIDGEEGWLVLEEESVVRITQQENDMPGLLLEKGELYLDYGGEGFELGVPQQTLLLNDAIVSVRAAEKSTSVQVLNAATGLSGEQSSDAGSLLVVLENKTDTSKLKANDLSDQTIAHALLSIDSGRALIFDKGQLERVLKKRQGEKNKNDSDSAQVKTERVQSEEDADSTSSEDGEQKSQEPSSEAEKDSAAEGSDSSASIEGKDIGSSKKSKGADSSSRSSGGNSNKREDSSHSRQGDASGGQEKMLVTIEIRCDTILSHKSDLASGKEKYVPSDGAIVKRQTVEVTVEDTVFDVLKAVCRQEGIHLEYRSTAAYGGVYIEGINHLREFDCGDLSGWVYMVNGHQPNKTCSDYRVSNGDSIAFAYTCEGLGADVQ